MKYKYSPSELFVIRNSEDVANAARFCFDADRIEWTEEFIAIALDRTNAITGFYKVAQGGLSGVLVDARVIFQFALLSNSSSLIIAHNHPSGSLNPSKKDREFTQQIKSAGKMLGIKILDHVIVASHGYYSFTDNGDL